MKPANAPAAPARAGVRKNSPDRLPRTVPVHLGASPHEQAVTEFEQSLICATEAFFRFIGLLLGAEGRGHNLSGQDNVILQQLMSASRPRGVIELSRFANRDDIANIQYSLRKLIKAGLVQKAPGSTNRETSYEVTEKGRTLTAGFLAVRRELLMQPTARIPGFENQLREAARAVSLITSFYDQGTRVLTRRD